jgi:hypothetical protein
MRLIPATLAVAALPLLATACSAASPAGSPAPPASSAAASPDAGVLTGAQLKARLAPASWFPPGFKSDPSVTRDTGSGYQSAAPPATKDCTRLNGSAWIDLSHVSPASFAQGFYADSGVSETYAQEIDGYPGTSASQAMAGLRKLATTCPSFADPQTSSTVTVHLEPGPKLGDDALTFELADPHWAAGTALVAVRVGTSVVTVLYAGGHGTGVSQATSLAAAITASLAKA